MIINSDSLPKEDLLDRIGFAKQIAKGLAQATTTETSGFVTGLTGKWGSGKTTLLNNVKDCLSEFCSIEKIEYIIIDFNPWAFTDSDNLKKSFLTEFVSQLQTKQAKTKKKWIKVLSKNLEKLDAINSTAGKIGKAIGGLLNDYLESNTLAIKNKIDQILLKENKKIFIFVDDIDRLHPKQVFELLQVLKLTCNFKNTYYIIAYDREAVELSIESQFKNYGKKYLDKIVQADFLIPEPSDEKVESIFFRSLETLCKDHNIPYNVSSLSSIWLHKGLQNYFFTLRDIYRYINSLQFSLPIISNDIDITDFLILEAIRLNDFDAYQQIQTDLQEASIVSNRIKFSSENYLQQYSNSTTKKLIEYLFPSNPIGSFYNTQTKRLYDTQFSERYFTLQISSKDITEIEFGRFMELNANRTELLNNILELGRIDNLIIRLNDVEIQKKYSNWDFNLIKDLYDFFDRKSNQLESKALQLSDAIINLLSIDAKKQNDRFNKFIDLLLSLPDKLDNAKIYFLHFMLLSKQRNIGFPSRYTEFKEFYLARHEKIETYYRKYLRNIEPFFFDANGLIREPLSLYTSLFVYDWATYLDQEYRTKLPKLFENERNMIFFLKNFLSISSNNEASVVNLESLNLLLPGDFQISFAKKLKEMDLTRINEEQQQWREFAVEYFKESFAKIGSRIKNFTFSGQKPPAGFPEIDDHYFSETLDLINFDYEIMFTPRYPINHWRCGFKFSTDGSFPKIEKRHSPGYPVFHLEKNIESNQIKASYYNETNTQEFSKETTIKNYNNEPITILISFNDPIAVINVIDQKGASIIDTPLLIPGFPWCKVFAWGDSKNNFEISARIIEEDRKIKELVS